MDIDPNELTALITLVVKHEKMLAGASHVLYGQSQLLETLLPKCFICDKAPLTVRHRKTGMGVCERCASEQAIKKKETEENWIDIPEADAIRRLVHYVDMIREVEPVVVIQ